jgi:hypothetical protein
MRAAADHRQNVVNESRLTLLSAQHPQ